MEYQDNYIQIHFNKLYYLWRMRDTNIHFLWRAIYVAFSIHNRNTKLAVLSTIFNLYCKLRKFWMRKINAICNIVVHRLTILPVIIWIFRRKQDATEKLKVKYEIWNPSNLSKLVTKHERKTNAFGVQKRMMFSSTYTHVYYVLIIMHGLSQLLNGLNFQSIYCMYIHIPIMTAHFHYFNVYIFSVFIYNAYVYAYVERV